MKYETPGGPNLTAHLANARHVIKRIADPLHVIVPLFNPIRYVTRYNLYKEFIKHAEDSGATVWVVEVAFGERPFEFADPTSPRHIQLRTTHELWHKESAINAVVQRLPLDAKYIAWVDGDITFLNPDWVHETIQQLQHYQVVQMFTNAVDAGPSGEFLQSYESFVASYLTGRPYPTSHKGPGKPQSYYYMPAMGSAGAKGFWHPGYAWACRKEAWNTMGGLLDINLVGGGDFQMALALIGLAKVSVPEGSSFNYENAILAWEQHALDLKMNIGVVPGSIVHHWHGKKSKRGYFDRWKALTANEYDPTLDIRRDTHMLWALTGNKPQLRDDLRAYMRSRCEDEIEL